MRKGLTVRAANRRHVDGIALVSTALAAIAALLSAVSAVASWRSTRAVEAGVELNRAMSRYQLFQSFEDAYTQQYSSLWDTLGPWDDPVEVDDEVRRTVHDLLQALASIHIGSHLGLIEEEQSNYLFELFLDWLRLPTASRVWTDVFRIQEDVWPPGFAKWVDSRLAE